MWLLVAVGRGKVWCYINKIIHYYNDTQSKNKKQNPNYSQMQMTFIFFHSDINQEQLQSIYRCVKLMLAMFYL